MSRADVSSKWVLGGSPSLWVQWLLDDPALEVEELLTTEFQYVGRASDSLLRVRGAEGAFLVLTKVRLHADSRMPLRVRAYAALAEEKYALPVYPVVFYLLTPGKDTLLPDHYHSEFRGLTAHQDFQVVKAWELNAQEILAQEIVPLAPFVPLMRDASEGAIREAARLLRQQPEGERLETVLALFASFVMDVTTVQQIVRWNMLVLRESPLYQEILQEGLQEGLQQGMQQGMQQGIQQGMQQGIIQGHREAILSILRARLDLSATALEDITNQLDRIKEEPALRALVVEAAQAVSLSKFRAVLDGLIPSQRE